MQTFKARRPALSAALAVVAAACGAQVNVHAPIPGDRPGAPADVCPTRLASVTNPTTGAVNVFIDRRTQAGYGTSVTIGTVDAGSTGEFQLSTDDGSTLQFEWATRSGVHDDQELGEVHYKIRCQTKPRDF
jgi:hypothetical protein